ncbi:hypothetical protein PPROV_000813500 [Pycnococcus provasolii]|uniref:IST1 homolog n=1 Tax=Pycnococcus provasolii TaxID=41880 RepID=A0A830HUG5_9CHLO|nr:hypothetical protein PPROV_000813500 [Pycnococcus provasolii]
MLASLFGAPFKGAKCKTNLRLAMGRIKLLKGKRAISLSRLRVEIAALLRDSSSSVNAGEQARIRVEGVLREEDTLAAYEVLEIFCELLAVRMPLIEQQKECPVDLREAVASVLYAAPRLTELAELKVVATLFSHKYGKNFARAAMDPSSALECGCNPRIVRFLGVEPPRPDVKLAKLSEIAAEQNVDWSPREGELDLTSPGAEATVIGGSTAEDIGAALAEQKARRAGIEEPLMGGDAYIPPEPVPFVPLEQPGMAVVPPPPKEPFPPPPPPPTTTTTTTTTTATATTAAHGEFPDAASAAAAAAEHARAAEEAAAAAARFAGPPLGEAKASASVPSPQTVDGDDTDDFDEDDFSGLPSTPITSPEVRPSAPPPPAPAPTHDENGFPISPNADIGGGSSGNEDTLAARLAALKNR